MLHFLTDLLKSNPLFAGGLVMGVVGWAVVQLRDIPVKLFNFLRSQFSTTMLIYSEDVLFPRFELWLAQNTDVRFSRRFSVTAVPVERDTPTPLAKSDGSDYKLTPGVGMHILRRNGQIMLVNKKVEESTTSKVDFENTRRKQTISLTSFGRSQKVLAEVLNEIKTIQHDTTTCAVYAWHEWDYRLIERRQKRSLDTIYINPTIKDDMVADIDKFYSRQSWYNQNSIPFRRGYFLDGPPGTGKTSFIFALASHYDKSVYLINLASIKNDGELLKAINEAGPNFVVIEDIDSYKIVADRLAEGFETQDKEPDKGVTLSGLLNAVDGIAAKEGRLLFITSNTPDKLDKALLRPGRIDHVAHLNYAEETEVAQMFARLFPNDDPTDFLGEVSPLLPLAAAELQNRMLARLENTQ